jgi:capsule polysaccharide modification protein KpsS
MKYILETPTCPAAPPENSESESRYWRAPCQLQIAKESEKILSTTNPALVSLAGTQSLLMLQGPVGPLFNRIAKWKQGFGHTVTRIVFNGGDEFYCADSDPIKYTQTLQAWPAWLRQLLADRAIDGILLFGQNRPYHREAIRICRIMGIKVFVMEEGYVRPGYMTLEIDGVNAYSTTLEKYQLPESASVMEPRSAVVDKHCLQLMFHAALYYAFLNLGALRYRQYQHHRRSASWRYALYWAGAAAHYPYARLLDFAERKRLDLSRPYFFFPLQLESDAQIKHHSRYADTLSYTREILKSFAMHARTDAQLIVKQHPLALGRIGMRHAIVEIANQYGIRDRLIFLHTCEIHHLLHQAAGVVTVNSTVGIQAIRIGVPVKVLGDAIYKYPAVVDLQPLDHFWKSPKTPDKEVARQYHRRLKVLTQVPAALYAPASSPLSWNEAIFVHKEVRE